MEMVAFGLIGFFCFWFGFLEYKYPALCPGEFPLPQGIMEEEVYR